jgi:hypothetical protein
MNDQVLMNDAAARSSTGEILDQMTPPAATRTTTSTKAVSTTAAPPVTTDVTPPADKTPPADGTTPPAKTDAPVVPETYAAFKAPDNYTIDPAAIAEAAPIFKELGLTQDQAQKLVDAQIRREIALAKAPDKAVTDMRNGWRGQVEADAELKATVDKNSGKTGMDAVKINIARTLSVLPIDLQVDFKDAMNLTGAGDHPAFVKAITTLAAFVTEGSHVTGSGPSQHGQVKPGAPTKPDVAAAMYPTLPRG